MVIYAIMKTFFGAVAGLIALLPTGDPPSFITNVAPTLHTAVVGATGLGAWIPWATAFAVVSAVFALWTVLTGVSAVRYLLGWIPTMGGA